MKELAFIADDFGRDAAVNAAVLESHRDGGLTGASLMPGQPGDEEALRMARDHPSLQVGWHVHLCDSIPTTGGTWPWGGSPLRAGLSVGWSRTNREFIRAELNRQWEWIQAGGVPCRFINSHHHLHLHPWILRQIQEVTDGQFDGWLRGFDFRLLGRGDVTSHATRLGGSLLTPLLRRAWPGRRSTSVWGVDRLHAMKEEEISSVAAALPDGLHEFIFHPRAEAGDNDRLTLLQLRRAGAHSSRSTFPAATR